MSEQDPRGAGRAVRIERHLAAPPERVFETWLDPASMARWLSPTGRALATTDPRPDGRFRVVMLGNGTEIEHVGRYLELVRGRRLRFTWRSPYTGGDSIVTVELAPAPGGTRLTLLHEGLPGEHADPHAGGWGQILDLLAAELATSADRSATTAGRHVDEIEQLGDLR
jgi:uncharacterized protein YndB with AHSA1/START domain